jgi:hypothetical protein
MPIQRSAKSGSLLSASDSAGNGMHVTSASATTTASPWWRSDCRLASPTKP